jgi:pimeloyl-ACP methyl ester carboxylesterase
VTVVLSKAHVAITFTIAVGLGAMALAMQVPGIAAGGLLYPHRNDSLPPTPANCVERLFAGDGATLRGWDCRTTRRRAGTLIYLHGTADNRGSGTGVISRYTALGFDVVAYDSRRHGFSEGDVCTYGYFEKRDLARVIDAMPTGPVVLFGTSLGAAVALQEASTDGRISAIISAEVFSDLESIARYRAPRILPEVVIQKAFAIAENRGGFSVSQVSPVEAAQSIKAPVLLLHGAADRDTPPEHSRQVFAALPGPKRLIIVEGAGHNQSLSRHEIWSEIDQWIKTTITLPPLSGIR